MWERPSRHGRGRHGAAVALLAAIAALTTLCGAPPCSRPLPLACAAGGGHLPTLALLAHQRVWPRVYTLLALVREQQQRKDVSRAETDRPTARTESVEW